MVDTLKEVSMLLVICHICLPPLNGISPYGKDA
ncbi:hypothetical protein HNR39_001404 [Glaciimonas immobilis]|uniref:Uncharacterized protein n=1 Tax=Glaciimonas immobilis TaxID=728004 RepID=A0A840RMP8_9BURK|nr:hypothetical protein [Glaciimonas immobilis]